MQKLNLFFIFLILSVILTGCGNRFKILTDDEFNELYNNTNDNNTNDNNTNDNNNNNNEASVPSAPTGVTAVVGNTQVTVSWEAITDAISYNLYYTAGSAVTLETGTKVTGVTSPNVVTGLTDGTQYAFAVTAVNSAGESDLSTIVTATPNVIPSAPTGIICTAGNTQTTVTWSAVSNATSYNLYYAVGLTVTKESGTKVTGAVSPHAITGLINGSNYAFGLSAVNSAGESDLSAVATVTPNAPSAPSGLYAYYSFEDNLNDVSGNGHNLTLSGSANYVSGKINKAIEFTGSGSDFLLNNSYPTNLATTDFTFVVWMKHSTTSQGYLFNLGGSGGSYEYYLSISNMVDYPIVGSIANTSGYNQANGGTTINTWVHVAGVWFYDSSDSKYKLKLYKNAVNFLTIVAARAPTSDGFFEIGRSPLAANYFKGLLDEVRIYTKALTDVEILYLMNLTD